MLATSHAGSAHATPDRIINAFPPYYQNQIRVQLSNVLAGVVAQRLLPRLDGGLVPATEIMVTNQAIRNLIRENKASQIKTAIETGKGEGMMTFEQSISELIDQKLISPEVIRTLT